MENFADYILNEKDLASKMEIVYYLAKKENIFFENSVIFKTEIARMFLKYAKIEVDHNLVLTVSLLCNCKKIDQAQDINQIHAFAKKGADYLSTLGFGKKFCKVCEEINRYSNSNPREKESDILELVDNFGGMLLDRPERIGFKADEALILLEHRNLKDEYNRYLNTFIEFVNFIENIKFRDIVETTVFKKLVKTYNETKEVTDFIKKIVYEFEPKIDKIINEQIDEEAEKLFSHVSNPNRALFSEETTKKIMGHMNENTVTNNSAE
jgi:hypothetical protein